MSNHLSEYLSVRKTAGSDEDTAFKLLAFFRKYPFACFNRLAVVQALDYRDLVTTEKALNLLIKDGKIVKKTCNNTNLYSLAPRK